MAKEKIEKGTTVYLVARVIPHIIKVRKVVDIVIEDGVTKLSLTKTFYGAHNMEIVNFPSDNLFLSDDKARRYQLEMCIASAKREIDSVEILKDLYGIFKRALNISWFPDQETIPIIIGGETPDNLELQNERYWMKKNIEAKNIYLDALIREAIERPIKYNPTAKVAGSVEFGSKDKE